MSVTDSVLGFLEENKGKYISGGEIASILGVSRNAVWKAVKGLQEKGYNIGAVTNKGYILSSDSNIVSGKSIEKFIEDKNIRVEYFDSVTSTNTVMKEKAEQGASEGLVVVSSEQTAGRGRRGKQFISKGGTGIYFSILLRPELNPRDALLITTCAAAAVSEAIEKNSDIKTKIKWVNDIYSGDKKICGILTEAAFDMEGGGLNYAVLGIGINIYFPENSLPDEIKNIAGAVFKNEDYDREAVSRIVADTINIFMREYVVITEKRFLQAYRQKSYLDGKEITVIKSDGNKDAVAMGITDDFSLIVKYKDGSEELLSSGEVSTRVNPQ